MQKLKLLWNLAKPFLAAIGITKPADVNTKVIDPIKALLETMSEVEAKQAKSLDSIAESMAVLARQEHKLESDLMKAAAVKRSLHELLGDD